MLTSGVENGRQRADRVRLGALAAALLAVVALAAALWGAPVALGSWTAGHAKPAAGTSDLGGQAHGADVSHRTGGSVPAIAPGPLTGPAAGRTGTPPVSAAPAAASTLAGGDAAGGVGLAPLPPAPEGATGSPASSGGEVPASSIEAHPAGADPAGRAPGVADPGAGAGADDCVVRPTRPGDGFDPFYGQVCWALGIPVLASADVAPRALVAAGRIVSAVLGPRPDLVGQLVRERMRVGVLGVHQRAVELPEYRDLPSRYPSTNWDSARAYSATAARPLLSAPEENLTCSADDTYPGQQVLVHELGHSVMDLAVRAVDPTAWDQVQRAYDRSIAAGRWVGYYGGTSATEYWAEGVQAYFGASRVTAGPDPLGTPVGSAAELAGYDPALFALVSGVFGDNPWRATCP